MSRREELKGHAAMLTFSALVAGSFSFGGRVANDIDPMALTAVRFLLAAVVVGGVAWATGQMSRSTFRAPWRHVVLGALFGTYFVLMFEGLKTAHPVSAAAVFTLMPVLAAIAGWIVMRQVTTPRMAAALAIGAAGAFWVIFRGSLGDLLALRIGSGEVIYFVGCIAHALYIPLVPKLNRGERTFAAAFGTMAAGAIVVGLAGAGRISETAWLALPFAVWAVLLYLVLFASVASISLVQYASMRLKAAKVMAYTYLTPSWVILWELALAGDVPPVILAPGVALTVAALAALLLEGRAPQETSDAVSPSS